MMRRAWVLILTGCLVVAGSLPGEDGSASGGPRYRRPLPAKDATSDKDKGSEKKAGKDGDKKNAADLGKAKAKDTGKPTPGKTPPTPEPDKSKPAPADKDEPTDVIILTNGHRLCGSVDLSSSVPAGCYRIATAAGEYVLLRSMVAHIEISFDKRLAALKEDDYGAHLALAQWCMQQADKEYRRKALGILERFKDSPALSLDGLMLLARLIDEFNGPQQAEPLYVKYRERGGADPKTLARLAQIEEAYRLHRERLANSQAQDQTVQPEAPPAVAEGLEANRGWKSDLPQFANPVRPEVIKASEDSEDRVLQLTFSGGSQSKAAAILQGTFDVRLQHLLQFKVFNAGSEPVSVSLAIKCGPGFRYFETREKPVPADAQKWNVLEFDLTEASFKCDADNFRTYSHGIASPEDVRELQIQIHNGRRDGVLCLNDMGFLAGDE